MPKFIISKAFWRMVVKSFLPGFCFFPIFLLGKFLKSLIHCLRHTIKNGLFDGTALIANDSGIVYHRSFGFANQDYKIPNQSATVFRIGSLEKQFTAMLIMQLVEKGKISMSGKITDYLPLYRKTQAVKSQLNNC